VDDVGEQTGGAKMVLTDSYGEYRLTGLVAGTYRIQPEWGDPVIVEVRTGKRTAVPSLMSQPVDMDAFWEAVLTPPPAAPSANAAPQAPAQLDVVKEATYGKLSEIWYETSLGRPSEYDKEGESILTDEGFGAAFYKNNQTGELVVSFRGTDTRNPRDIASNFIDYATGEWERNKAQVMERIQQYLAANPDAKIVAVGHSQGGMQAQYLGYELLERGVVDESRLAVRGHNSPGGLAGLKTLARRNGVDINQNTLNLLAQCDVKYFSDRDDLITTLGSGHLGAEVTLLTDGVSHWLLPAHGMDRLIWLLMNHSATAQSMDQGRYIAADAAQAVAANLIGCVYDAGDGLATGPGAWASLLAGVVTTVQKAKYDPVFREALEILQGIAAEQLSIGLENASEYLLKTAEDWASVVSDGARTNIAILFDTMRNIHCLEMTTTSVLGLPQSFGSSLTVVYDILYDAMEGFAEGVTSEAINAFEQTLVAAGRGVMFLSDLLRFKSEVEFHHGQMAGDILTERMKLTPTAFSALETIGDVLRDVISDQALGGLGYGTILQRLSDALDPRADAAWQQFTAELMTGVQETWNQFHALMDYLGDAWSPRIMDVLTSAYDEIASMLEMLAEFGQLAPVGAPWITQRVVNLVTSYTPEDKWGPGGYDPEGVASGSEQRFIRPDGTLPYRIEFWNKEDAEVPTVDAIIIDELDPAVFDLSTLEFTRIGFLGWDMPLAGGQVIDTVIDCRPEMNIAVEVKAGLGMEIPSFANNADINDNTMVWWFHAIDPLTGEWPDDPMAGFLPPFNPATEFEIGWIEYTVDPVGGLAPRRLIRMRRLL